jgi:hypothetical protein
MYKSKEYHAWARAKQRCINPNNSHYKSYGRRGIQMCEEWLNDFGAFYEHMGDRPPGYTLDRIDVNGNYEPGNCQWIPMSEQQRNVRKNIKLEHKGEIRSLAEIAEMENFNYKRLWYLVQKVGLTLEKALQHKKGRLSYV